MVPDMKQCLRFQIDGQKLKLSAESTLLGAARIKSSQARLIGTRGKMSHANQFPGMRRMKAILHIKIATGTPDLEAVRKRSARVLRSKILHRPIGESAVRHHSSKLVRPAVFEL